MKKITFLTLAILAGASLSAMNAQAQGTPPEKPAFAEVDADGNGEVTPAEMRAFGETRKQARFDAADADGDGSLNRAELLTLGAERAEARVDRMIETLDSDGDGMLSVEEMEARRDDGRRGHRGRDGGARGEHRRGDRDGDRGERGAGRGGERMFGRADTDGSGTLSAGEWAAMGTGRPAPEGN